MVNQIPLLFTPFTVTNTFPVIAALGTSTSIWVLDQEFTIAGTPLKVTILDP
jgi:hypothetical protein